MTVQISRLVLEQYWGGGGGGYYSNGFTEHKIIKKLENGKICLFFLQGAELWYCNYIFTILLYFVLPAEQCMRSPWGGSVANSWSRTQSQGKRKTLCALSGVSLPSIQEREIFPLFFLFSGVNHDSQLSPLEDVPCQPRWCQEVNRHHLKLEGLF